MNNVANAARAGSPSFSAAATLVNLSTRSEQSTGLFTTWVKNLFNSSTGRGMKPLAVLVRSRIGPMAGPCQSQETPLASPGGARQRNDVPGKASATIKTKSRRDYSRGKRT
jgi:hypothetical protein